jgi:hypothetical protein
VRLYSRYKDYYDVVQRTDQDPLPKFVRDNDSELVVYGDKARFAALAPLPALLKSLPRPSSEVPVSASILGFCGRLLPVFRVRDPEDSLGYVAGSRRVWRYRCFVSVVDTAAYFRGLPVPEEPSDRLRHERVLRELDHEKEKQATRWTREYAFNEAGWEAWQASEGRLLEGSHDDLFRLLGVPVFLVRGKSWRLDSEASWYPNNASGFVIESNPVLKDLGWHRHAEPYQVWQAIDQYLGNQMSRQEDPLPLSDELRRDAHGFDDRSFKTDAPGQRKARRKANKARKRAQRGDGS